MAKSTRLEELDKLTRAVVAAEAAYKRASDKYDAATQHEQRMVDKREEARYASKEAEDARFEAESIMERARAALMNAMQNNNPTEAEEAASDE